VSLRQQPFYHLASHNDTPNVMLNMAHVWQQGACLQGVCLAAGRMFGSRVLVWQQGACKKLP